LLHLLAAAATSTGKGKAGPLPFVLFGIAFILIGGLNLAKPDLSYRMNRWQYKNKEAWEPSNAALVLVRIGGALAVVIGIVLVIVGANR